MAARLSRRAALHVVVSLHCVAQAYCDFSVTPVCSITAAVALLHVSARFASLFKAEHSKETQEILYSVVRTVMVAGVAVGAEIGASVTGVAVGVGVAVGAEVGASVAGSSVVVVVDDVDSDATGARARRCCNISASSVSTIISTSSTFSSNLSLRKHGM